MPSSRARSSACVPIRCARTCSTRPPACAWPPDPPHLSRLLTTKETKPMSDNRRKFLKKASAGAAAVSVPMLWPASASAQQWNNQPEKGATLRVLRWKRFVQGDEDAYMANVKKFTDKYGIPVRVDNEGWEDVRPKAAVAANTG